MGTGRPITQSEEPAAGQVAVVRHVGMSFAAWLHRELSALVAAVGFQVRGSLQRNGTKRRG
eukprot:4971709-Pyramimonas_sp.AAC.1